MWFKFGHQKRCNSQRPRPELLRRPRGDDRLDGDVDAAHRRDHDGGLPALRGHQATRFRAQPNGQDREGCRGFHFVCAMKLYSLVMLCLLKGTILGVTFGTGRGGRTVTPKSVPFNLSVLAVVTNKVETAMSVVAARGKAVGQSCALEAVSALSGEGHSAFGLLESSGKRRTDFLRAFATQKDECDRPPLRSRSGPRTSWTSATAPTRST